MLRVYELWKIIEGVNLLTTALLNGALMSLNIVWDQKRLRKREEY